MSGNSGFRSQVSGFIGLLFFVTAPALGLAWLIGWTLKDRTALSIWFYFIPAIAVVLYGAAWLCITPATRHPRVRVAVRWITVLAAAKIGLVDVAWKPKSPVAEGAIRVTHWNVGRSNDRAENQFKALATDQPDLCLLSESPRHVDLNTLARKYLGYPVSFDDAGMTLITKFPCEPLGSIRLTNAKGWAVRVSTPKGPLDVVAIDLVSHPTLARLAPIAELSDWIAKRPVPIPLIVLGDFNTPRDATSFDPLRSRLRHAYEIAGRGWPYSWPVPLCVYSIDHAWVTPSVRVLSYTMKTSMLSDHRRQVMDVDLPNDGPGFLLQGHLQ